jgi:hypothetical protein
MEHEFGSGLRAHLEKRTEPEPQPAEPPVVRAPRPSSRPDLDVRLEALAAAEAELTYRERHVGERELAFQAAVQRVVYRLAQEMLVGGAPALPEDELAVARARRSGTAA